ncbi:hypothetical protein Dalk_2118 [Desulfatibacillum aliphaticivorans]|uniref:Uncharacterized protein n=1 Tax=Desulfatibacillum aliphaticivorans TaxID=218208 RepID=B8FGD2_DESAL|nr:hypothetical protein [Desulfatibacillum aliphaticivorans]ACL03812.1 hypothetical protein Dalk_2118 [Desulfatibacillum aliphaticivorans]
MKNNRWISLLSVFFLLFTLGLGQAAADDLFFRLNVKGLEDEAATKLLETRLMEMLKKNISGIFFIRDSFAPAIEIWADLENLPGGFVRCEITKASLLYPEGVEVPLPSGDSADGKGRDERKSIEKAVNDVVKKVAKDCNGYNGFCFTLRKEAEKLKVLSWKPVPLRTAEENQEAEKTVDKLIHKQACDLEEIKAQISSLRMLLLKKLDGIAESQKGVLTPNQLQLTVKKYVNIAAKQRYAQEDPDCNDLLREKRHVLIKVPGAPAVFPVKGEYRICTDKAGLLVVGKERTITLLDKPLPVVKKKEESAVRRLEINALGYDKDYRAIFVSNEDADKISCMRCIATNEYFVISKAALDASKKQETR